MTTWIKRTLIVIALLTLWAGSWLIYLSSDNYYFASTGESKSIQGR